MLLILFVTIPLNAFASIPDRPTTSGFVFDYQNVINDEVEQELNKVAEMLNEQNKMQLFILTVPTIGDMSKVDYGVQVIRQWGIGQKDLNNGMLIFATTDQGEGKNIVRIAIGQGLEGDYPDGKTGRLLDDYMMPYLVNGDYTTAFSEVVDAIRIEEDIDYDGLSLSFVEFIKRDLANDFSEDPIGFSFVLLTIIGCILSVFLLIVEGILMLFFGYKPKRSIWRFFAGGGSSDDSGSYSSDSYSGGGGSSSGGGSDRNF